MHPEERSPISYLVDVRRLPKKGFPVTIEADERQRRLLAEAHGLESVERFVVRLVVAEWKRDGVSIRGEIDADIVQACVVTLEPIAAHLSPSINELFAPSRSKLVRPDLRDGGELLLDAEGPDAPETFEGDQIDVGALAEEIFALSIDPYPRLPEAALEQPAAIEEPQPENTLRSQLEKLRNRP